MPAKPLAAPARGIPKCTRVASELSAARRWRATLRLRRPRLRVPSRIERRLEPLLLAMRLPPRRSRRPLEDSREALRARSILFSPQIPAPRSIVEPAPTDMDHVPRHIVDDHGLSRLWMLVTCGRV